MRSILKTARQLRSPGAKTASKQGGKNKMDKNGLSSFLLGLGVGVGIGMLFAPKSGPETRDFIKNKASEGSDYLKQQSEGFRQSASEWVEKGKEALNRQRENLSDAMEAGRQAYRETVNPKVQPPTEGMAD
jgi:gas vesicle protein